MGDREILAGALAGMAVKITPPEDGPVTVPGGDRLLTAVYGTVSDPDDMADRIIRALPDGLLILPRDKRPVPLPPAPDPDPEVAVMAALAALEASGDPASVLRVVRWARDRWEDS